MKGWLKIINEMKELAEPYDVKWLQIKEKFGTLRAYFSCPPPYCELVEDIVREAEMLSSITCIVCGKPGALSKVGGHWILTLCGECEANRGEE
ncbi:MAG: hypothetical protein ACYSSM_06120 [Planctomycetota bacterium]